MPSMSDFSNESDWMSSCVSTRQDENPDESQEQSVAACLSMWRDKSADKNDKNVIVKTHVSPEGGMEFVLSDATPDRYDDIIVAEGWSLDQFKRNPIALFNHNPDFPIGRWHGLEVKGGALRGHLQMAPEGTSARIDEIRKLIDAGILRAVSVGFRPLEMKPRDKSGSGQMFVKSELLETSLVSVPANPNALAIARGLKISDDTRKLVFAEHGAKETGQTVRRTNGEHAETKRLPRSTKMETPTISTRVRDTEQRLAKYQDALEVHLKSVDDENPSEEQTSVTEEWSHKIEQQTRQLESLRRAEKQVATKMRETDETIVAKTTGNGRGTAMEISGRPFAMPAKKLRAIDHLWRGLRVDLNHHVNGRRTTVLDDLRDIYGENEASEMTRRTMSLFVTKAASAPAMTTTSGWADSLVQTVIADLLVDLEPLSVYPKLAAKGSTFTFGRNGVISLPVRTVGNLAGAFVGQGAAIPVKQGAFTATTITPRKMAVITTLTRDIAEHSTPAIEGIIREAILNDTGVAIDTVLLDATAGSVIRPAGLKNGVSKVTATSGGGIAAVIGDLGGLVGALITGTSGNLRSPVWIINPGDVAKLSLIQGATGSGDFPFRDELARGVLLGYPVIQSTTGTSDVMFLIDAADFATATGDAPNFAVSDQATLHMEDTTPLALSTVGTPNTVAAPVRSLWQTDTIGIRMILDMNWTMRRTGCVQWSDTMTWN